MTTASAAVASPKAHPSTPRGRRGPRHQVPPPRLLRRDHHDRIVVCRIVDAVGGVWQYATALAEGLQAHGFETVLALLGPGPSNEQRAAIEGLSGVRLVETGQPLDWLSDAGSGVLDTVVQICTTRSL